MTMSIERATTLMAVTRNSRTMIAYGIQPQYADISTSRMSAEMTKLSR